MNPEADWLHQRMKLLRAFGCGTLPLIVFLWFRHSASDVSPAADPSGPLGERTLPATVTETGEASVPEPPAPAATRSASGPYPGMEIPAVSSLLSALNSETDVDRRLDALNRAMGSISISDVPTILTALEGVDDSAAAELRDALVQVWATANPRAAAIWAEGLPEGSFSQEAMTHVAIAWANADTATALAWARSLPEGDNKQAALTAIAYETARTDPLSALEVARTLPPTRERDVLLMHTTSQWASTEPSAAGVWAEKVPDPSLRQRLLATVAVAMAARDGAAGARLAGQWLVAGEEQERAVVAIAQRWARQSPSQAVAWVAQFPDSPTRRAAMESLAAVRTD
jgi:hypothetical protein